MSREQQSLYDRACAGDGDAYWQLVLPHRGLIYAVAFGLVRSHERAEDLLHDVLVHAFRTLPNLREVDRLPSWLYTVARNRILDALRRESRTRRVMAASAHEPRVIPMGERLEKEAWLTTMETAMEGLPEPFRLILAMKYMNHYKIDQIAEMLDITPAAAKSRLFHARKLLRDQTQTLASGRAGAERNAKP
jgi:RNA polymerase sigma-70 factor (ECF subfamily)